MQNQKPRMLILGATGQVGGHIVKALKDDPSLEVIAAARNIKKGKSLGVSVVHLDLDRIETFGPALQGVDRLFMATGYTVDMLRQSKDLVSHAKRAGVKLIVHLGGCGNDDTRVAHYGWHQFIERYIACSGIPFAHLRPEIFLSHVLTGGAEPAYIKCVFDSYTDFTNGVGQKADEVFDNFPALVGREPRLLSDFVRKHADQLRY